MIAKTKWSMSSDGIIERGEIGTWIIILSICLAMLIFGLLVELVEVCGPILLKNAIDILYYLDI